MKDFIKKIMLVLFLFIFTITNALGATWTSFDEGELFVDAKNAIALDGTTKEVLFSRKGYDIVPMASTTKILTAN